MKTIKILILDKRSLSSIEHSYTHTHTQTLFIMQEFTDTVYHEKRIIIELEIKSMCHYKIE